MFKGVFLGVDVGTSVIKATIAGEDGAIYATVRTERCPESNSTSCPEHDADAVWWAEFRSTVCNVLEAAPQGLKVLAIGITGMAPNACMLDKSGRPIRPAMLYYDARTSVLEAELNHRLQTDRWQNQSLARMLWLKKEYPSLWQATSKIVSTHTYLVMKLTGEIVVDTHTAREMGSICDSSTGGWNHHLLQDFELNTSKLPCIAPPISIAGYVTEAASKDTGLQEGVPVVVGTTDTIASLMASGVRKPGEGLIYYGTYGCLPMITVSIHEVLRGRCAKYPIEWLASVPRSGPQLVGLARLLFRSDRAVHLLDEYAARSKPGAGGVIFVQTPDLLNATESTIPSGRLYNILPDTMVEDICRAALEAFGYALKLLLIETGVEPERYFAGGGGAKSDIWRQVVSDILQVEQHYSCNSDGALGACMIAALGVDHDIPILGTQVTTPVEAAVDKYESGFAGYTRKLLADQVRELGPIA